MAVNIVNMLTQAFAGSAIQSNTAVAPVKPASNPFGNPFVTSQTQHNYYASYAKNNPVQGGYFAGYYNGKANIVGQRLFVEA